MSQNKMKYYAISIDTQVVDGNHLRLESGLLAQLFQFKKSSVDFVLSEIVEKEIQKHLITKAESAKNGLYKAIKEGKKYCYLSKKQETHIDDIFDTIMPPEDIASQRLSSFKDKTGAIVVSGELAELKEIIKRYFAPSAPFKNTEKKKYEFPDAIALLSLEAWAEQKGEKMLVVSGDSDWKMFSETSEWIDCEEKLSVALEIFQPILLAEKAKQFVDSFLLGLEGQERVDVSQEIDSYLSDAVSNLDVYSDAYSAFYHENDGWLELFLDEYKLKSRDGKYVYNIVQINKELIVVEVGVSIKFSAETDFTFSVYDSFDKDYTTIGGCHAKTEQEFNAVILITIEGDFIKESDEVEIAELDLRTTLSTIDFGEIEPDYEDDYRDE